MRKTLYLLPLCAPFVLAGCFSSGSSSSNDDDNGDPTDPVNGGSGAAAFAKFNAAEETPFPNPMLFDQDAQRVAMEANTDELSDLRAAYNTRDGFSTVAPLWLDFSETLNTVSEAELNEAVTVRAVDVAYADDGSVQGMDIAESGSPAYRLTVSRLDGSRLYIKPETPLEPRQHYMVTVEADVIEADDEEMIGAGGVFAEALAGESAESELNELAQAYDEFAKDNDLGDLALAFHFRTQSTMSALEGLRDRGDGLENPVTEGPAQVEGELPDSFATAGVDVYDGRIELPYYLQVPEGAGNPDDPVTEDRSPLQEPWEQQAPGTAPSLQQTIEAPFVLTVPSEKSEPETGWPMVVVYHGLTGNRTNLQFIAGALADRGLAAIHIDQPWGGLIPSDGDVWDVFAQPDYERHFFTAYADDSELDEAGDNFSPRDYLLTARDNRRQAAADLMHLVQAIQDGELDNEDFEVDPDRVTFTGLSNATITGTLFVGVSDQINAASLAVPGAGLAKMVDGAPRFQGDVRAYAQAERGLIAGTLEYEEALILEQGIVDAGDPINYARSAGDRHPIHMINVVGLPGDPDRLPDLDVPTQVYATADEAMRAELGDYTVDVPTDYEFDTVHLGAPLSGSEALADVMGLEPLSGGDDAESEAGVLVRFTDGAHVSWLLPPSFLAGGDGWTPRESEITDEMQRQTASFLESDGASLDIQDDDDDSFIK